MDSLSFHLGELLRKRTKKEPSKRYDSLLDLIFELFSSKQLFSREAELYLYQYLEEAGLRDISDLSQEEAKSIQHYLFAQKDSFGLEKDAERLTYLLLAAIQRKSILVILDEDVIDQFDQGLTLKKDSVLEFIRVEKIDNISFKTL